MSALRPAGDRLGPIVPRLLTRRSGHVSPVFFDGFDAGRDAAALYRYRGALVMASFWLAVTIAAAMLG